MLTKFVFVSINYKYKKMLLKKYFMLNIQFIIITISRRNFSMLFVDAEYKHLCATNMKNLFSFTKPI